MAEILLLVGDDLLWSLIWRIPNLARLPPQSRFKPRRKALCFLSTNCDQRGLLKERPRISCYIAPMTLLKRNLIKANRLEGTCADCKSSVVADDILYTSHMRMGPGLYVRLSHKRPVAVTQNPCLCMTSVPTDIHVHLLGRNRITVLQRFYLPNVSKPHRSMQLGHYSTSKARN